MLVLSRKLDQSIVIDGNIRVVVVGLRGGQVRLGIEAPGSVHIVREELCPTAGPGEGVTGRCPGHDQRGHAGRPAPAAPSTPLRTS